MHLSLFSGYSSQYSTWEPEENIIDKSLIEEFEKMSYDYDINGRKVKQQACKTDKSEDSGNSQKEPLVPVSRTRALYSKVTHYESEIKEGNWPIAFIVSRDSVCPARNAVAPRLNRE